MPERCEGSNEMEYPLGISKFVDITGEFFKRNMYKNINFRYYVAGLEDINKVDRIVDNKIISVPMHDMSYLERSVPPTEGIMLRYLFGNNIFERASKQIKNMKKHQKYLLNF